MMDAVRENAEWCDLVCRSHGLPTTFGDRVWHTARRSPPFHPDAETLDPAATADELLANIDTGPGCSVKDSFAVLDLTPHGFRLLFEAEWIHRPAAAPDGDTTPTPAPAAAVEGRSPWVRTRSGVPDDPAVAAFEGPAGRVVAHLSGAVVGLSNLTGDPIDEAWTEAVNAITAACPGLPIVGYETADDLPPARRAGFTATGPLRVWIKEV